MHDTTITIEKNSDIARPRKFSNPKIVIIDNFVKNVYISNLPLKKISFNRYKTYIRLKIL